MRQKKVTSGSETPPSSVLSSQEDIDLQMQQAAQFQLAFQQGTLGFGFSAGGLLFPYYLGVAQQLQELGILRDSTQLAGASAGSLIVACVKSGLDFSTLKDACFELARDCRDNGTRHRLRHVLEATLRELLPHDVASRCSGAVHVAVTRLRPGLTPALVNAFEDREDLIQALLTSCHIPWYFDGSLVRRYRTDTCFDGGLTNFLPNVPGATTCRVCCLPRGQLAAIRDISISPDTYTPWPHSVQTMVNWALEPADEDMLEELIACGRRDALQWAQQTGLAVLASGSSMDSPSSSVLGSMDGVWLPVGSSLSSSEEGTGGDSGVAAAATAAGRVAGEEPVGASLVGLVKALVSHSASSRGDRNGRAAGR